MSTALKALVSTINLGYSHVQFDGKLVDHLVDAGHEVHFMIAVWDPRLTTNGSEKAQRIIRYVPRDREGFHKLLSRMAFKHDHFKNVGDAFGREQMQNIVAISKFYADDVLSNSAFLDGLRKERYDIGMAESIDATAHEIFRVLGIKTTFASTATALSSSTTWPLGLPQPPSFISDINATPASAPYMSYWERAYSLYREVDHTVPMFNAFEEAFPNSLENIRRASFHFINSNEFVDMARPVSHKIKYIGGAAMPRAKPLEGDLLEVVNRARSGVVYFSFGSIVDTESMPAEVRDAFLRSFASFPEYEFIWKFAGRNGNASQFFDAYPNVHSFKWVDQVSLLAHPKTKGFITHCGMNSLQEAAHYGVPLIAVPFFGDQTYNAAVVRHRGIGVYLSKTELTETAVTEALRSVLLEEGYRKNMATVARKIHATPFKPEETLVKWIEFASEFEGDLSELDLAGAEMSFLQLYCLDIILPFVSVSTMMLYVFCRCSTALLTVHASKIKAD